MRAQIISFHCVLKDNLGNVISSTFNQDVITRIPSHSGAEELPQGVMQVLDHLAPGEKRSISLIASQAYGFYDPDLVMTVPRKSIQEGSSLRLGDQVYTASSRGEMKLFRVIAVDHEKITLDANHPLAGRDLEFSIETTEVRDATPLEISDSGPSKPHRYLH